MEARHTISTLRKYEKDGWIVSHEHKTLPLIIWNYSQSTQYEQHWDEVTLMCRGLVTNTDGVIIARGFSKFFNYEENRTKLPTTFDNTTIMEKLDGSFIMIFHYNGEWIIMSKGSFYSEQVDMAREIFKERMNSFKDVVNKTVSYCFELIHPQNQIVVNYGDDVRLVYLGSFDGGREVDLGIMFMDKVKKYDLDFDYTTLKENQRDNAEGYVVKFNNGERCKIKFDEYKRLHSIVTNATSYTVYDALRESGDVGEILERIPDEFYEWVQNNKHSILFDYYKLKAYIYQEYSKLLCWGVKTDKEFAQLVNDKIDNKSIISFMFNLRYSQFDSMEYNIWRRIKPQFKRAFQ